MYCKTKGGCDARRGRKGIAAHRAREFSFGRAAVRGEICGRGTRGNLQPQHVGGFAPAARGMRGGRKGPYKAGSAAAPETGAVLPRRISRPGTMQYTAAAGCRRKAASSRETAISAIRSTLTR